MKMLVEKNKNLKKNFFKWKWNQILWDSHRIKTEQNVGLYHVGQLFCIVSEISLNTSVLF